MSERWSISFSPRKTWTINQRWWNPYWTFVESLKYNTKVFCILSYIVSRTKLATRFLNKPLKPVTKYKMTSNFNGVFSFFWTQVSTHLSYESSHCLCSTLYLVYNWVPPRQFPTIPSLSNTYFSWREFWSVTSRNDRGSVFSCSRGWPDTFDTFLLTRCTLISLKTAPTSVAEISRFQ